MCGILVYIRGGAIFVYVTYFSPYLKCVFLLRQPKRLGSPLLHNCFFWEESQLFYHLTQDKTPRTKHISQKIRENTQRQNISPKMIFWIQKISHRRYFSSPNISKKSPKIPKKLPKVELRFLPWAVFLWVTCFDEHYQKSPWFNTKNILEFWHKICIHYGSALFFVLNQGLFWYWALKIDTQTKSRKYCHLQLIFVWKKSWHSSKKNQLCWFRHPRRLGCRRRNTHFR